jgi:hypothetical protein
LQRLVHSYLGVAAIAAASLLVGWLLTIALRGTPLLLLLALVFVLAPSAYGAALWRSRGRGWLPIASWTVPLASVMVLVEFVAPVPSLLAALAVLAGWVAGLLMADSDEVAKEWYTRVLHREL